MSLDHWVTYIWAKWLRELRAGQIDQVRQNKVSLIVRDFEDLDVPRLSTLAILMTRGVFKWFACRRDLIRAKNDWRKRVTAVLAGITLFREAARPTNDPTDCTCGEFTEYPADYLIGGPCPACQGTPLEHVDRLRLEWLRGYLRALETCRAEVRAICHSKRWRPADDDFEPFAEICRAAKETEDRP